MTKRNGIVKCRVCGQRPACGFDAAGNKIWKLCSCSPYPPAWKKTKSGGVLSSADPATPEEIAALADEFREGKVTFLGRPSESAAVAMALRDDEAELAAHQAEADPPQDIERPITLERLDAMREMFLEGCFGAPMAEDAKRRGPDYQRTTSRRAEGERGISRRAGQNIPG